MRTILYIAGKDLLLRWRDRLGFFWWMLGFPLLISVLIGSIFAGIMAGPHERELAVVDAASSDDSREFIEVVRHADFVKVMPMSEPEAFDAVRTAVRRYDDGLQKCRMTSAPIARRGGASAVQQSAQRSPGIRSDPDCGEHRRGRTAREQRNACRKRAGEEHCGDGGRYRRASWA